MNSNSSSASTSDSALEIPLPPYQWLLEEQDRRRTEDEIDASRERCRSLRAFVAEAWHLLEPGHPFVANWHIDAICEHLEAITDGRINRLLINVPPGTAKSLIVSVLWPAWEWGPAGRPSLRYLSTSYNEKFVTRDTRRMRDLVKTEWYQRRWGSTVQLVREAETSFANTATGNREGAAFGSLTSGRGDRVILDDPHSTEKAESDADRDKSTKRFREQMTSRVNDVVKSAIVVVMQRLHTKDISGVILTENLGYEHLCLPMRFVPKRRCVTSLGFQDPRTKEGELLFPARWPEEAVKRDERTMGSYAVAGQYQQDPRPRGGGRFKREWFPILPEVPGNVLFWVRSWDLAGTEGAGDFTVGTKLGWTENGEIIVANVVRGQWSSGKVEKKIVGVAQADGVPVRIDIPQDPGQAGKAQIRYLVSKLTGYVVHFGPETGDKVTRAMPLEAQAEVGNIKLVEGPWNEDFLEEVSDFPVGEYDDQVDALARGAARIVIMVKQGSGDSGGSGGSELVEA